MIYLLLLLFVSYVNSTDIVFLIDSSTSLFNDYNNCSHQGLIRNFTSEFVNELKDCDINYSSFQ